MTETLSRFLSHLLEALYFYQRIDIRNDLISQCLDRNPVKRRKRCVLGVCKEHYALIQTHLVSGKRSSRSI